MTFRKSWQDNDTAKSLGKIAGNIEATRRGEQNEIDVGSANSQREPSTSKSGSSDDDPVKRDGNGQNHHTPPEFNRGLSRAKTLGIKKSLPVDKGQTGGKFLPKL